MNQMEENNKELFIFHNQERANEMVWIDIIDLITANEVNKFIMKFLNSIDSEKKYLEIKNINEFNSFFSKNPNIMNLPSNEHHLYCTNKSCYYVCNSKEIIKNTIIDYTIGISHHIQDKLLYEIILLLKNLGASSGHFENKLFTNLKCI